MNRGMRTPYAATLLLAALPLQAAEPLTLQQVVRRAVENSPEVRLARLGNDVAVRQTALQRSAFQPNLFTGSGAAYTNGFPQTPGGGGPSVFSLSFVQTLFNPPLRGEVRAAEQRSQMQQVEIERVRDAVMQRAAADYLELVTVRHSLRLLEGERDSAQRVYAIVEQRVAAGLELPIEQTRAALVRARIEQRIAALEGRQQVLEADLRDLLGLPESESIELAESEPPPFPDLRASEAVALALRYSPELRKAALERLARQQELQGQRGGYWPSVDLVGQYSVFSKINNYDQFYRNFQRNNLNVGLQIQIPLFRSRTRAEIALADSQLRQAEGELTLQQRSVERQVRQQFWHVRELEAGREVARLELQLARQNLDLAQARFQQGQATLADVERARLEENEKWLAFLDAGLNYQKSELELLRLTGRLAQWVQSP